MISTAFAVIAKDRTCTYISVAIIIISLLICNFLFQTALDYEWYWSVLAAAWLAGLYIVIGYITPSAFKARRCDKSFKTVKGKLVAVLEKELNMMEVYSPTIIHVFDADDSWNRNEALAFVRTRARDICTKNPFLLGRLRSDTSSSYVAGLWIPDDEEKEFIDKTFSELFWREIEIEKDDVEEGIAGFIKRESIPKSTIASCGQTILDEPNHPVAKMSLLISKSSNKFAIVFSQCHILGDGHSMWKIFNLFDPAAAEYKTVDDIPTFDVPRSLAYDKKIHHLEFEGKQHLKKFAYLVKEYLLASFFRFALPKIGKKYEGDEHIEKATHKCYSLRKDWIDQEKTKYQRLAVEAAVDYHKKRAENPVIANQPVTKKQKQFEDEYINIKISSNDVLLKFIFESLWRDGPTRRCPLVMIAFEFRSRFIRAAYLPPKPIPEEYIGNYFELMFFNRDEVADPMKIRRIVNSKGRSSEIDLQAYDQMDLIPEMGKENLSRQIPIVINNTRFYKKLDFKSKFGFKTLAQMPLILVAEGDEKTVVMHEPTAFIFTSNDDGEMGLYVYSDGQFKKNDEAPLGGEVKM